MVGLDSVSARPDGPAVTHLASRLYDLSNCRALLNYFSLVRVFDMLLSTIWFQETFFTLV
jgi:hypothetical protein